jgi:hypothetical protein
VWTLPLKVFFAIVEGELGALLAYSSFWLLLVASYTKLK